MLSLYFFLFASVILISLRRNGSIGLVAIFFVFINTIIFNKPLASPSLKIGLIILSVITATSSLSASGGISYIANIIERLLVKHKSFITIIAPIFTFFVTLLCGTPYIVLAIIPIVVRISIEENLKPVYTITSCIVAANHAYLCSPIGSPFIVLSHFLKLPIYYVSFILIISCFIGVLVTIIVNYFLQEKFHSKKYNDIYIPNTENTDSNYDINKARKAVFIFIFGVFLLFSFGLINDIRPFYIKNDIIFKSDMFLVIPLFMFSISFMIIYLCNINVRDILAQKTMEYGFNSIITIIGISWLANTFIENNRIDFFRFITDIFNGNLIILGLILFFSSVIMASQTAALLIFIPIYLSLNVTELEILRIIPFVDGLFFIPLTAIFSFAIECDKTKSIKSGKYIFNHSLMIPGFIATLVSILICTLFVKFIVFNIF